MKPGPANQRSRESGYAMLLIFLMAALVAISLYSSLPSIAFEAERDQEQLLVDRGEQYKRAIQLYYRKVGRYPGKLEDLESTNGIRFLRKKYVDPLTGKAEWRLIHVGPGGVFTDSLTQKSNNAQKKDPASVNTFITELKPIGGDSSGAVGPVNLGLRRRGSDQGGVDGMDPAFPTLPANDPQINGGVPNGVGTPFGQGGLATNAGGVNGLNPATGAFPTPNTGANNALIPSGSDMQPGQPGSPNSGANMIRNLLTSPRPGGPPGFGGNTTDQFGNPLTPNNNQAGLGGQLGQAGQQVGGAGSNFQGGNGLGGNTANGGFGQQVTGNPLGQTVGGGIAGVASTASGVGIKIYKEHSKYKEWEFIYDYGKDLAGRQNLPNQNQNANLNQNGQNGTAQGTGTGGNMATGANAGNGNAGAINIPPPPPQPVPTPQPMPQPAPPDDPGQPVEGDPIEQ